MQGFFDEENCGKKAFSCTEQTGFCGSFCTHIPCRIRIEFREMGSCCAGQKRNDFIRGRCARVRKCAAAGARIYLSRGAQPLCGCGRSGRVSAGQFGVFSIECRLSVRRDNGVFAAERGVRSKRGEPSLRRGFAAGVPRLFCAECGLHRGGAAVRRQYRGKSAR